MKLLLDEMLSSVIAAQLRSRGHDALAIQETPGWEGLSDPEVIELARSEHRAIVTDNLRDYRPLHQEAITPGGAGHYGMVSIHSGYRRTKSDVGRIVAALEAKLSAYPGERDLVDGEAWL